MNKQEVYNKVRDHLLAQGRRSTDPNVGCLYRGPDGTKCAVGCLIDDEHFDTEFNNLLADHTLVEAALHRSGIVISDREGGDRALLRGLQSIHDGYPVEEWKERLERLATDHGLEP